jgi:hypothetical protein
VKQIYPLLWILCITFNLSFSQATYYVSLNGNDANIGSQSQPWRTIKNSIPKLSPSDILLIREGTYHEQNINIAISGTANAPITIKNFPGEHPVIDGSITEFFNTPNIAWELYDSSKNIYKSISTYPSINKDVYGYMGNNNGNWKLLSYERFAPFISNNQNYANDGNTYCGPGIYYNTGDQKIYVRLEHSVYQHDLSRFSQEYNFPPNVDPRQVKLHIFADVDRLFTFNANASYLIIEGIDLKYANTVAYFATGSHHISLKKCQVMGGRFDVQIRDLSHDVTIDNVQFTGFLPPWLARSDVKKPTASLRPMHLMQGAAISIVDNPYNIIISNSNFSNHFDAIDATKGPHQIHIHHNVFSKIKDDVLQLGSASYDIEINHNSMTRVTAGISWNGSGQPPSGKSGTKYIHHNIIDTSELTLYGRIDPNNQLDDKNDGPFGTGMATGRAFGMHTKSSITGADPWKIYHNTLVIGQDVDRGGTGVSYTITAFDTNQPHEVYNNIILQKWDANIPSDFYAFVIRNARIQDGSQIFDGNLYYRTIPSTSSFHNMFTDIFTTENGSKKNFAHLNDLKNDSQYMSFSRQYYTPGWENSGLEGNPELDANFIPSSTGLAASGAIDLSNKGWPGITGEIFRGALDPNSVLAVSDEEFSHSLKIYPNPINDILHIEISNGVSSKISIEIFNELGVSNFQQNFNSQNISIPIQNLAKGIYFVKIKSGEKSISKMLIKR